MLPSISGTQMAEIDRIMMEEIGVNTYQLMEVAGWQIARLATSLLSGHAGDPAPAACVESSAHPGLGDRHINHIVLLAGTGGNGGDAMVAARLLTGWGHTCTVLLSQPRERYRGIAAHQLAILDALSITTQEPDQQSDIPEADLIIDGLLGFSLRSDPRGFAAVLIERANQHPAPVLAIDIPSGLNADTGSEGSPCVRAHTTVTLALPKKGLILAPSGITGEILVADIGVPPTIYRRFGLEVSPNTFRNHSIVALG